ncbi:hypothetical protein KEM55_001933, partial [Ascosphaera atra]
LLPDDNTDDGIPSTTNPTGCTLQPPDTMAWVAPRSAQHRGRLGPQTTPLQAVIEGNNLATADGTEIPAPERVGLTQPANDYGP